MKFKIKKFFFLFLLFLITIIFILENTEVSLALEVEYPPILGFTITKTSSFVDYAGYFFNVGIFLGGVLAVLVIVFGGIYYLVSLGRGKFTDEGKQWIKAGILGLALLMSAYLFAYTINPDLVYFRLEKLFPVGFFGVTDPESSLNIPKTTYEEIPLGILTENLLSRTMACYDFDKNGEPIETQITTDDGKNIPGPTYLDHDRVDCFLKLSQAIEKKSDIITKLSEEIAKLMEQCQCSEEKGCEAQWKANECTWSIEKPGEANTCPANAPCNATANCECTKKDKKCELCPPDTKAQIEHGPIKLIGRPGESKEYRGLDEFRSQFDNNYESIKNKVEVQPPPQLNGKQIAIINNGNCQPCDEQCPVCDPNSKNYSSCLKEQQKCQEDKVKCEKNRTACLKQNSPWYNLRLIDQLTYLKGKLSEIKSKTEADLNQLNSARTKIAECYNVKSSVDLLNIFEETKEEDKIILVENKFIDPETQQQINSSKYCKGFDYAGSVCYSKCQNICPESMDSNLNLNCYRGGPECDDKEGNEREICLQSQKVYIKGCYNNRQCPNTSPFNTFQNCMNSCKQECFTFCDKKYFNYPDELNKCKKQCNNDSKCLLDNEEKCTVNFLQIKQCADIYKDPENLKNCMNNSFLCKYSSDQYAGYPDCLQTYYNCINNFKGYGLQSSNQCLVYISSYYKYSSSFLYKNPAHQKCPQPYELYTSGINLGQTCLKLYPETAKCPLVSMCPECPCGIVDETITFPSDGENGDGNGECPPGLCRGPDGDCSMAYCGDSSSKKNGGSNGGSSTKITKILEYRVSTGSCNEFNYNGDSLTFYCATSWEPEGPISGKWFDCSKTGEIPVGQTVDSARKWADEFIKNINDFINKTEDMIQYIKKIGEEKGYCECNSECVAGGERACNAQCEYHQDKKTGSFTSPGGGEPEPYTYWLCHCVKPACSGNPCQKMINLLLGKTKDEKCPKNIEYKGVKWHYEQISNELKKIKIFVVTEKRTDIVKELSYSRKGMNNCSQQSVQLGANAVRTFSCTKAYRGILALDKRCYGIYDGQLQSPEEDKTDNWFCCKTLLK